MSLLVALPWLVHTAQVWGDPFHSDVAYALWPHYHARAFADPWAAVSRFCHSISFPPSSGEMMTSEPISVITFVVRAIPDELRNLIWAWGDGRPKAVALILVLALLTGCRLFFHLFRALERRKAWRGGLMAALTYALTAVIALAPRSQTLEVRYYALLSVLLGLLLGWGFIRAVKDLRSTPLRKWTVPLVSAALGAVLWANVTPQLNASAYRCQTTPYEPQVKYFGLAQEMNARYGNGKAVVVGDYPYEYTFVTGEPALSIPESDDA